MEKHGYNASHGKLTRSDFDDMGLKMSNYDFRTFKEKFQKVQLQKLKQQLQEDPDAFLGSDTGPESDLSQDSQVIMLMSYNIQVLLKFLAQKSNHYQPKTKC